MKQNGWKRMVAAMLTTLVLCTGCAPKMESSVALEGRTENAKWHFGFGREQIIPDENSEQPLYIAGYDSGYRISKVLDYCEARAVWMDTGAEGALVIGIDCVGMDNGTVAQIREGLKDLENCASINVYSTHTHAGPDTLGLWGPVGVNGKNDAYMERLIAAAIKAGKQAAADRKAGKLYYGLAKTEDMYRDSREPIVYDENLYQLRFEGEEGPGLRMYFYGAHAESLRGDNRRLSRDFPGMLCDGVTEATGDNTIFAPGAIGGLIMTKAFVEDTGAQAVENLQITGEKLIRYALSITPESERELAPSMALARTDFEIPLDNVAFQMYKTLGILGTKAVKANSATGYAVVTELSVLMLDDIAVTMIPGELFPELASGQEYGNMNPDGVNPKPLVEIAAEHGVKEMLIIGLCNDEVGYIVPPSDFLLNPDAPYLKRIEDERGEDHYEETNSVGPACAGAIADAFTAAMDCLFPQK